MTCLSWTWLYITSVSSVMCSRSPVIWYRSLTDWASPLSFSQPRIYTLAVVSFEKTCEQWGKMVKYKNQGPVVWRPILGLTQGYILIWVYFYLVQKHYFWITFSIYLSSIESSKIIIIFNHSYLPILHSLKSNISNIWVKNGWILHLPCSQGSIRSLSPSLYSSKHMAHTS